MTRACARDVGKRPESALPRAPVVGPGSHAFTVTSGDLAEAAVFHVPYPARLDFSRANPDSLTALAAATGGSVLADGAATEATGTSWVLRPQWVGWALIALALFFLDLGIRYAPSLLGLARRSPPVGRTAPRTLGRGLPA